MINPLAIATRGRLTQTVRRTITLATLGWIVIVSPVPPPSGGGGGGDVSRRHHHEGKRKFSEHDIKSSEHITHEKLLKEKLIREDEEIVAIIKIWTKCSQG